MKMKKYLMGILALAIGLILVGESEARTLYSLGTASTAGTYYILGAGFASHINKRCSQLKITAEITSGALENYNLIKRKKLDLALMGPSTVIEDLREKKYGGGAKEKVRSVLWSYQTTDFHWFVRKNSPIKDFCDVKGKTVGVGPMGAPGLVLAVLSFRVACGYEPGRDYKALNYSWAESQTAIKDNTIDMGSTYAGYPVASVTELARGVDLRFISLTREQLRKVLDAIPGQVAVTIPAGTYKGIDSDTVTHGSPTGIVCRADLPEQDVYAIIKALFTDVKERNKFHPQAEKYSLQAAVEVGSMLAKLGLGYHPGVIRYLKEVGAWKPELEVK
jgi:TRAP transporter TAXI family solute receptor